MHITNITIQNIRGVSGSWDIGPAAMIIADNFAGKSAVLSGIRLGVFGYLPHPRKDKTVPPIDLCSADDMSVSLTFDDGRSVIRSWHRDKKGRVSADDKFNGPWPVIDGSAVPEVSRPILMDPKSYFDQSADKRMQFVFSSVRLPAEQFSPESLLADIKNTKLEANTEFTELALTALLSEVRDMIDSFHQEQEAMGLSVQDLVGVVLAKLKEKQKLAKQTVDRMAKTIGGLAELEAKEPATFDDEIGTIDRDMAAKRAELDSISKQLGAVNAEIRANEERMRRRQSLEVTIAKEDDWKTAVANCQQQIASLKTLPESAIDWDAQVKIAHGAATATYEAVGTLTRKHQTAVNAASDLRSKHAAMQRDIENAGSEYDRLTKECASASEEFCPDCQKKIQSRYSARLTELKSLLTSLDYNISQIQANLTTAVELVEQAERDLTAARTADTEARRKWQEDVSQRDHAARSRAQRANQLATEERSLTTLQANLASIETARKELAEMPVPAPGAVDPGTLQHQHTAVRDAIRDLDQRRTAAVQAKTRALSQITAKQERDRAEAEQVITKAAVETVTEFQRKMVDAAFGSIITVARRFTDGLLNEPLEYRDGEVGRFRNGIWVPNEQFSDAEQIITYAAMSCSLGATAPFKLVTIDEITRVRGERKRVLMDRMIELIEDSTLDQFVGVDVHTDEGQVPVYYQDERISIIKL
jgi:PIN domain nuclease of toxin-antitoxin system